MLAMNNNVIGFLTRQLDIVAYYYRYTFLLIYTFLTGGLEIESTEPPSHVELVETSRWRVGICYSSRVINCNLPALYCRTVRYGHPICDLFTNYQLYQRTRLKRIN